MEKTRIVLAMSLALCFAPTDAGAAVTLTGSVDSYNRNLAGTTAPEVTAFRYGCERQEVKDAFLTKDGMFTSIVAVQSLRGRMGTLSWTPGSAPAPAINYGFFASPDPAQVERCRSHTTGSSASTTAYEQNSLIRVPSTATWFWINFSTSGEVQLGSNGTWRYHFPT